MRPIETNTVNCWIAKLAVTVVAAVIVVVQVPVPVQPPPDQLVNVEPVAGVAVSVTDWLKLKSAAHVAPQSMPVGFDVRPPLPLPALATLSLNRCSVNVAVTVVAAVSVVVHVLVPVQPPPDQLVNVEPVAGVAVSVTDWLKLNSAAQVPPQPNPGESDVSPPLPLPALATISLIRCSVNFAVPL